MTRRPIEIVEDLATHHHGPGAAVSIDREKGSWRARVWDARGQTVRATDLVDSKTDAVSALRKMLDEERS